LGATATCSSGDIIAWCFKASSRLRDRKGDLVDFGR
jgi:hypothetical protein